MALIDHQQHMSPNFLIFNDIFCDDLERYTLRYTHLQLTEWQEGFVLSPPALQC